VPRRGREIFQQKNTCDDKCNILFYRASGETVDTLALGASAARHGSSSLPSPTKLKSNMTSGNI
jgi:hypothetical protein